jgi:hypothetical protein
VQVTAVAPTVTNDGHLNALQAGVSVTVFYTPPKGAVLSAEINLFLVIPLLAGASTPPFEPCLVDLLNLAAPNLHWCGSTQMKVVDGQKIPLASVREMREGQVVKDSPVMKHDVAKSFVPTKCFQVVGAQWTLNLAAQSHEAKDRFMHPLDDLFKK